MVPGNLPSQLEILSNWAKHASTKYVISCNLLRDLAKVTHGHSP